ASSIASRRTSSACSSRFARVTKRSKTLESSDIEAELFSTAWLTPQPWPPSHARPSVFRREVAIRSVELQLAGLVLQQEAGLTAEVPLAMGAIRTIPRETRRCADLAQCGFAHIGLRDHHLVVGAERCMLAFLRFELVVFVRRRRLRRSRV